MFSLIHTPFRTTLAIHEAFEAWKTFCLEAPESVKKNLTLSDDRSSDDGYNYRSGLEQNSSEKEFFHFATPIANELTKHSGEDTVATEFIAAARNLIAHVDALTRTHVHSLNIDGLHDEIFTHPFPDGRHRINLRFLHYLPSKSKTIKTWHTLAHPHIDYCGLTLNLAETAIPAVHGGMEYLDYTERTWRALPSRDGFATCFPGFKLQEWSDNKLIAPCHRVRVLQSFANTSRFSLVAFVSLAGSSYIGPRLQDMVPGFNYSLTPGEVTKFFL